MSGVKTPDEIQINFIGQDILMGEDYLHDYTECYALTPENIPPPDPFPGWNEYYDPKWVKVDHPQPHEIFSHTQMLKSQKNELAEKKLYHSQIAHGRQYINAYLSSFDAKLGKYSSNTMKKIFLIRDEKNKINKEIKILQRKIDLLENSLFLLNIKHS